MDPRHRTSRQIAWDPGLDNGRRSLAEVYETLPGNAPSKVPWYVRTLEHPSSPLALAGATDLFGHDCIHVVLGRGLTPQDEAFVLGFTMGASRRSCSWQRRLYRLCAQRIYRGAYRFSRLDGEVFDFAVEAARSAGTEPLHRSDFYRARFHHPLGDIRRALGVKVDVLARIYERERERWPHTLASGRLRSRPPGVPAAALSWAG
jgi:hypothetical protein